MRKRIVFGLIIALFTTTSGIAAMSLSQFDKGKVGKFPKNWRTWPFQRGDASRVYKIKEENGKKFISAYDEWDLSEQIFYRFPWNVYKEPMFSWQWRPKILPTKAREDKGDENDSACGVYVIFGQYTGHALKYVWSTTLPVGTIVTRREGKLKIKVIGSGKKGLNEWHTVTTDIIKDHKEMFGDNPPKTSSGIAILTDANATHTKAACDYTDFRVFDANKSEANN